MLSNLAPRYPTAYSLVRSLFLPVKEGVASSPKFQIRSIRSISTGDMSEDLIESAKRAASERAVQDHFDVKNHERVGIGSGSTIKYVVEAIRETCAREPSPPKILFVPTGYASRDMVTQAGLIAIDYATLAEDNDLDVAFDGADEVDEDFNLVKGGGACLFQEKLVASRAKKFVVVAGEIEQTQCHQHLPG